MSESSTPSGSAELKQSIERLDSLLASETVEEKIRAGMGIRLALGMAQELKAGKQLGAETTRLVADWVSHYGQDTVDAAVKIAREFLVKPEAMRAVLGRKLGLEKTDAVDQDGPEDVDLEAEDDSEGPEDVDSEAEGEEETK